MVTPALIDVAIGSTHPETSARIIVQNNFASDVELVATLGGLSQVGGRLVPSGDIDADLGSIISFQPNIVTVGPGVKTDITVYFQDSEHLSPGGHYGAITIRQTNASQSQVGLQAAVSVGMFVTKMDGAVRHIEAAQVKTNGSIFRLPTTVDVGFRNTGNVLAVPRAMITTSALGRTVAYGVANSESIGILPNDMVVIRTNLTQNGFIFLPGKYSTRVLYRAEGLADEQTSVVTQYYISPIFLIICLCVVALVIVGVRLRKNRQRKARPATERFSAHPKRPVSQTIQPRIVNDVVKKQQNRDVEP